MLEGLKEATVVAFILGFVILAGIFYYSGFWGVLLTIEAVMHPDYILYAVVMVVMMWFTSAVRWALILGDRRKGVPFPQIFILTVTSLFVNNITPGPRTGGEPAKAYLFSRISGVRKRESLATTIMDSYTLVLVFFFLALYSFREILNFWALPKVLYYGGVIGLVFMLLVVVPATFMVVFRRFGIAFFVDILKYLLPKVYAFRYFKSLKRSFSTYDKLYDKSVSIVVGFIDSLVKIGRRPVTFVLIIFLSFVVYYFAIMKTNFILMAFGINLPFFLVLILTILPELLGLVSWMPGGFGVTEISFVVILRMMVTTTAAKATAIMMVSRLVSYWFAIFIGFICTFFLWHRILKISREELWKKHLKSQLEE